MMAAAAAVMVIDPTDCSVAATAREEVSGCLVTALAAVPAWESARKRDSCCYVHPQLPGAAAPVCTGAQPLPGAPLAATPPHNHHSRQKLHLEKCTFQLPG